MTDITPASVAQMIKLAFAFMACTAIVAPSYAQPQPLECIKSVRNASGVLLYCTRDLSRDPTAAECDCRQIAYSRNSERATEDPATLVDPPVDEPTAEEPPAETPPKTGQNPGNGKSVGNAPFDGVRGEVPSGKPKKSGAGQ
jgi:hypothetical protein